MTALAAACLLLSAVTGLLCYRALAGRGRPVALLAALTVFLLSHVLPAQLLASLEMAGWVRRFGFGGVLVIQLLTLPLLWFRVWKKIPEPAAYEPIPEAPATSLRLAGGIVAACYLAFAVNRLSSYPGGWDSLAYHLPMAVRWLQEGTLRMTTLQSFHLNLPANGELSMWFALGSGWESLTIFPNLAACAALLCACYILALRSGASRDAATATTLILACVPMVIHQTFSNYVDLFGAGFLLAGVALFVCRNELPGPEGALGTVLSGLACGLAAGAKPTFYPLVAVFGLYAAAVLLVRRRARSPAAWSLTAVLLLAMLTPSIFWWGRAMVQTGNPLYPLDLQIVGVSLEGFKAPDKVIKPSNQLRFVSSPAGWWLYPWTEFKQYGNNQSVDAGLGAAFATFVPVGVLLAMLGPLRRRWIGLGALAAGAALWWLVLGRVPRFGIAMIAAGCIIAAPLFDEIRLRRSRLAGGLLVVSLGVGSLILAVRPLTEFGGRLYFDRWSRSEVYQVPAILDTLPIGSTVLNLNTRTEYHYNNYSLAGDLLTNRVLGARLDAPHGLAADTLRELDVDYVADRLGLLREGGELMPDGLRLLFEDERWTVWEVTAASGGTEDGAGNLGS